MGSSLLKADTLKHQLQQQYRSLRRYMDELYGDITIIQHLTTKQTSCLLIRITADPLFEDYLQSWRYSHNPMYLQLEGFHSQNLELCSRAKEYYIITNAYNRSVEKEVAMRQHDMQYFEVEELKLILLGMINVVVSLRFEKQRIPVLSSKLFLVINDLQLRIFPAFLTINNDGWDSMLATSRLSRQILSPEVSKVLHKPEQANAKSNQQPSIVFQLGVIILEVATLVDSFELFVDGTLDRRLVEERLALINCKYGSEFESVLRSMVEDTPSKRPTLEQTGRVLRGDIHPIRRGSKVIQEPKLMRESQLISNHLYL